MEASSVSASPRQSRLARDQKFGPWPRWASRAARTFSSTVSFGKILVCWNERPSPMPQILCGATPVTSRPLTCTLPAVGRRWPVIRLNSVDLPAPFGPITAAISPSATARSTSETARKPANDLERPRTSSIAACSLLAAKPSCAADQPADDPAGEGEQQDEKDGAEHERPIFGVGRDLLVEQHQRGGANHRSPEMIDAAEDGHDHHFGRFRPIDEVGKDAAVENAEQSPCDTGEAAGDHEGGEFIAADVEADRGCALRILPDRRQHEAERRGDDALYRRQRQQHHDEREHVELLGDAQVA